MVNRSKAWGTLNETATVKYLRLNGFPGADRQPLRGNRDAGDIALCPGLVMEVKAHKSAGTGQPGHAQLAEWMAQAEAERVNAGAQLCPLVVKRAGTTDVGRWFAYVTAGACAQLMGSDVHPPDPGAAVSMSVGSLVALLRFNGFGSALEVAS